tara:strand:- start:1950 stop:2777 length:828 start_codon:yes stop_codon:yes gene_type:complete
MTSLNEIPYEIYFIYFLEHLTFKEFGVLSMVSKQLKNIFDSNEFWKVKYLETTPAQITDKSVHIGEYCDRMIYKEDGEDIALSIRYLCNFNSFNETNYTDTPPPGYKFYEIPIIYINDGDDIYHTSRHCIRNLKLKSLVDCNIPGTTRTFWIKHQPESVQRAYEDYLKSKSTGITRCNCISHYDPSTLSFKGVKVNYKSYKKMFLKKLKTKEKKQVTQHTNNCKSKKSECKNATVYINKYKSKLKKLEAELAILEECKSQSENLYKNLDYAINSL